MTAETKDDLAKIRALIAEATTETVEHGVLRGKTLDQHLSDFRKSLTAPTAVGLDIHGVYRAGSETVLCHTGNGPKSEANARLMTFAFNNLGKMVDEIERLQRTAGDLLRYSQLLEPYLDREMMKEVSQKRRELERFKP